MRIITAEEIENRELTPQEKGWLRQRERFADIKRNEELFGRPVIEGEPEREAGVGPATPVIPSANVDADNYDSWKIKELKEEGEARTPPVDFTGCAKKEDYVLALRSWDIEHNEE